MRRLIACLVAVLAGTAPALAFDDATQDVLDRMKTGKLVPIADVGALMMSSERWCYFEDNGTCRWSDIYLEVTASSATFEIGNAWNADYDIRFIDKGMLEDGRYICETGDDWVGSVRADRRSDGSSVNGRELATLKADIETNRSAESIDCFDYVLQGSDPEAETITLLQRQYADGVTDPANDVPVTLHFNPREAASLTWLW